MAEKMEFPLQIQRQYCGPLDPTMTVKNAGELASLANSPYAYISMLVGREDTGEVFRLARNRTFVPFDTNSIKDYVEGESHVEGTYYRYDDYIWLCIISNTDNDFLKNRYVRIGDTLTLYDKEKVKSLLGLSDDDIERMSDIIDDTSVTLNRTWSSSKIYGDIQDTLKEAKKYTLKQISERLKKSYSVVATKDLVTSEDYLYLVGNNTDGYKIYALVDNAPFKLSEDTVPSLEGYLKETDAEQIYVKNSVFELFKKEHNLRTYTSIEQLNLSTEATINEIFASLPDNSVFNLFVSKTNYPELPDQQGLLTITKSSKAGFDITFKRSGQSSKTANDIYIGQLKGLDGSNLSWDRLCKTKISDITKTPITLSYPNSVTNNNSSISYSVTNGVCTINYDLSFSTTSGINWIVIATGLPKPKNGDVKRSTPAHNGKDNPLILNVNAGRCLVMYMVGASVTSNPHYIDSFSYQVTQ